MVLSSSLTLQQESPPVLIQEAYCPCSAIVLVLVGGGGGTGQGKGGRERRGGREDRRTLVLPGEGRVIQGRGTPVLERGKRGGGRDIQNQDGGIPYLPFFPSDEQTDKLKIVPSRRTWYAAGKNVLRSTVMRVTTKDKGHYR